MTKIDCQGVLFDLDGVLVDSTPAVARVWTIWARRHGFDPEETVRKAHGRPSLATIRELLPNADHAAENSIVERMEIEDVSDVTPLCGTLELLASLPANRWTVVTSCTRALALVRLRVAGLPVPEKMVTSTDIVNGKPHPEPYLKGAGLLGIAPQDCVVFEDAPAGIESARAGGMKVLGITSTYPAGKLAHADVVIGKLAQVRVAANGAGKLGIEIQ